MKAKLKTLKVDLTKVPFVTPSKVNDGTNGKILETEMIRQGFPIDQHGIVDLPIAEVKTRKKTTRAMHTVGTMTYDKIVNTPWDRTPIKKKLQTQYRVTINEDCTSSGRVVDLTHNVIQREFEKAYEQCRLILIQEGKVIEGTIKGGQYGCLEHKKGNGYAFRIPDAGMKKILNMERLTNNPLFEVS